jgi:pyruvate oxidase
VEIQYAGPGGFQEIDQDAFFRPVTVFNNTIYDKSMTVQLVTTALKYATVRNGVAQLSVPNNIQKEPLDASVCSRERCLSRFSIIPDEEEIKRASELISRAGKLLIIAGWGAYDSSREIRSLAEKISAPILTTFRAKGIFPDDEPRLIGILGTVGSAQARGLAADSDLHITLGVGFSKMTGVPIDRPIIQVDIDPIKLGKGTGGVALWGTCGRVIPKLTELVAERHDESVLRTIAALKKEWNDQREWEADPAAIPLRSPFIIRALSDLIPEDAIISIDVGENGWWFGRNFRMKRQRFVRSGYLTTMGFGLPGAIAAKIAYPDRNVFCITGDGGFSMAMADFITAVKYRPPMVVVIMNNRELGMIRVEQKMEGYPNYGTDLLNPDFAQYADNCGGYGIRVRNPGDLAPAIERATGMDIPVIVDVDTDQNRF